MTHARAKMARSKRRKPNHYTDKEIATIVYDCVGAASVSLWQTHPNDVFPSTEVIEAVKSALDCHGITDV